MFVIFGSPWHLKLFKWTLRELLFDLLLEVDELGLYFGIYVSLALEWTARICNDVTIGCILLPSIELLASRDTLTDTIYIIAFSQAVLPGRLSLLVRISFSLLHLLWSLLAARVVLIMVLGLLLFLLLVLGRCQFRGVHARVVVDSG